MGAAVYMFWILVLLPTGSGESQVYGYPNQTSCEIARATTERRNAHIPGFNIAPECIRLPLPQGDQREPT